jgi:hypothetical protein
MEEGGAPGFIRVTTHGEFVPVIMLFNPVRSAISALPCFNYLFLRL